MLCTFNDVARHENYHIVHAVKKDADKIKRENFHGKEDREDAYGTSVISIQMLKSGGFISIKNRYNHKVVGCDNTFNSNPNYIIPGLSEALKKYFNVAFTPPSGLPEEFVLFGAQILKYHTEHNNIYYGDQAWAKDGVIYTADRSKGDALFGGFLFKNATKSLEKIDPDLPDSFTEDFNRYYAGRPGLCVAKNGDLLLNGKILIGTKDSRITTLYLPEWKAMSDLCLYYATALTELKAPSLETMGGDCLRYADALTEFEVPKLTSYSKYLMRFIGQRPRVPPAPSV